MPFFTLSDAGIQFAEKELVLGIYTIADALSTTKRVSIIDRREVAAAI